ncbi:MFS family transporter [Fructilactobacillus fructivorans]|uniref:MFS transporter n=1 Tax=Fructilactobacillus fructivorans TaxID=1614 RepID=UPI0007055045|nr:MFS transporter [Fructilactobacillus fructivorans]KRN12325.1 MFS family transporter [Fructilactobacillus fructivorans]
MPKLTKYQRRITWSTGIGFILERMDAMFMSLALASIIITLHISKAQGGLLPAITAIGSIFGGIGFGALADRYGRVKTLCWTIIIYAIGTAGMGLTNSFWMLCLFRIIIGVGNSGEYGIAITMLSEAFSRKYLGRLSAAAGVCGQVGSIVASLLSAFILQRFGWHVLFFIGIIPVVLAWFIRFHLPESKEFTENRDAIEKDPNRDFSHWTELFATPAECFLTIRIMIMFMIHIAGYNGLISWLPSIAQERMHISVAGSSLWMIATIIGMSLGIMCFGIVQDHLGSQLAYGIWLLAAAASVFLLIIAQNKLEFLIGGGIVGFCSDGMYSGYGTIVSKLYPTEIRATANNTIMSIAKSVGSFSTALIGFLMDHFSLMAVILFLSGIYLVSFVIVLSIKELKHENKAPITTTENAEKVAQ